MKTRLLLPLLYICILSLNSLFAQPNLLQYKSQTQPLKYKFSTYAEGVQEAEGTRIVSERSLHGLVSLNYIGETEKNLTIEMTYDSLEISAVSELGETAVLNPSEVIGRRIKKVIARNGDQISSKELDEFGILQTAISFSTPNEFLTNLPDKSISKNKMIKMVDVDTVMIATGACLNEMTIVYKISEQEYKQGYHCVKIAVNGKAKLSGDFSRLGTKFFLSGQGVITGEILFAPDEGLLVSSSNQTRLHLNILTSGGEPVSIPVIQTSRSEIALLE